MFVSIVAEPGYNIASLARWNFSGVHTLFYGNKWLENGKTVLQWGDSVEGDFKSISHLKFKNKKTDYILYVRYIVLSYLFTWRYFEREPARCRGETELLTAELTQYKEWQDREAVL